jgi:glutathione synthase/RimK-type ligase-like ATP-grasp enzyme
MKLQYAGIRRNPNYSPNQITNDGLILLKTAQELMKNGVDYKIYDETEIDKIPIKEEVIFTMARGTEALNVLLDLEKSGKLVINSPQSTLNCYRINMAAALDKAGIPFPKYKIVTTNSNEDHKVTDVGTRKVWVKRGDVHAVHREDVSLVYGDEELNFILMEFAHRGIEKAILQEHIYGDVIKFYSVRGTDFFRWYFLNGNNGFKVDTNYLKQISEESADLMGLQIYGGDAIVSEDGKITIIDINDWPSFAPFRDEASKFIADHICSTGVKFLKPNH